MESEGFSWSKLQGSPATKWLLVSGGSLGGSSFLITLWSPASPEEIRPWGQGSPAMAQVSEATGGGLSPSYSECEREGPGVLLILLSPVIKWQGLPWWGNT